MDRINQRLIIPACLGLNILNQHIECLFNLRGLVIGPVVTFNLSFRGACWFSSIYIDHLTNKV